MTPREVSITMRDGVKIGAAIKFYKEVGIWKE
jgi:hypothetical protein